MKCRSLTVVTALFASALPAFAEKAPSAAAGPAAAKSVNLIELGQSGGPLMYGVFSLLLLLSVAMVALALVLLATLRRGAVVNDRFMHSAESLVRSGDIQGLAVFARRQSHRMAIIVQQTADFILEAPHAGLEEVRELIQAEGSRQTAQLSSRVTYLADIGAIAPLAGLLGTVIGMTQAFLELSHGQEGVKQLELTSGISHALITTAGGLVVAIPALVLYALFRGRALKLATELESAATLFVLELQMYSNRVRQAHSRREASQPQQHQPQPIIQPQSQPQSVWAPNPGSMTPRDLQGI